MSSALPPPPAPPAGPSAAGGDDRHPSIETLGAHLRGELPPAEAESVREHLTGCSECIDLLLDLDAFEGRDLPAQTEGPAVGGAAGGGSLAAERNQSWQRLLAERPWEVTAPQPVRPRSPRPEPVAIEPAPPRGVDSEPLRTAPAPPSPRGPAAVERRRTGSRRPPWRPALVAASLAAALLTGSWALHLQRRLAAPVPDQPVVDLVPVSVTRGGGVVEPFDVPPDASFTVVIVPEADRPFARYRAELVDSGGREVWRGELRPADPTVPYSPLSLGLSRRLLTDRRYTLRLWGVGAGDLTPAGEYPIGFTG